MHSPVTSVYNCSAHEHTPVQALKETQSDFDWIRSHTLPCPNAMHGKCGLFSLGKASSHSMALPIFFPPPVFSCFNTTACMGPLTILVPFKQKTIQSRVYGWCGRLRRFAIYNKCTKMILVETIDMCIKCGCTPYTLRVSGINKLSAQELTRRD